jgi:stearoyl-CoA desaturase (delta-9 desaturase)
MFFITAGYHRYFAHRSFKTHRWFQFVLALGGTTAAQKGVLWWAGHHRHHHRYSDTTEDVHSPLKGFWWSHVGWIVCDKFKEVPEKYIEDFSKYPELRWLQKYNLVPPAVLALIVLAIGGWSALFIGFFLSTILLYHGTFFVNSLTHLFGRRRFATSDTSRNSLLIALITCGEGWHNNHHHYQLSASQGFYWWEIDLTYYVLKMLSWVGVVWDLRRPTEKALATNLLKEGSFDHGMFEAYWAKASRAVAETQIKAGEVLEEKKRRLEEVVAAAKAAADDIALATSGVAVKPEKSA